MATIDMTGLAGLKNTLNGVFDQIENTEETLGVSEIEVTAADGDSLTVSYKDANGTVHTIDLPDIEVPEGAPTPELIASVLAKLDSLSTDITISDESMKVLKDFADKFIAKVTGELTKMAFDKNISVFDVMQQVLELLIKCAHEQQKLAHLAKAAAQLKEYAAILSQAAAQEKSAIAGMVAAAVSGALQTIVTLAFAGGGAKDVKQCQSDNGMPTALNNLQNTELLGSGDPKVAELAMKETGESLKIPGSDQTTIQKNILGGETEQAKNILEKVVAAGGEDGKSVNIEREMPDGTKKTESWTLEDAQKNYREKVDKAVNVYKENADKALDEFKAVRDNPKSTQAQIDAARQKLNNAQNTYQYANSVRTYALSQGVPSKNVSGNTVPVISKKGIKDEISARQSEYSAAKTAAKNDPAMEKALDGMDPMTKREMLNTLIRSIEGAVQSSLKLLDAEATRKGAEKTKAEQDAEGAAKMLQEANELIKAALQFMDALNASVRNSNMA